MSPNIPSKFKMRLNQGGITGYLYQRSRPAIVSDKKKAITVDQCAIGGIYVQYGRLLAYAYDPRDVCGTCRHDRIAILGSKMSTSGTRGLGPPVECASDQARRWCTTDFRIRQAKCRRRLDSGYARASCRQINMSKCLDQMLLSTAGLGIIRHTNGGAVIVISMCL
jgi:hypothetical protein